MTNKKLNYPAIAKEMAILTGAVAIIAAAVYFFLVPSHTSVSSISVDIACVVFDLTFLMAVKAQSCKYYDQNSNYNYGQTFFHNIESSLVSCILPFIPLCYKILS